MNIEKLLDRPIAFQRPFMELGAGASGALFLSQAVYWSNRTSNAEKWFYKTIEEWTEETGLSRHEQDGARKKLKAKGVLEIVKKGIPCKTFYRVNFEKLAEVLGLISATNKNAEIRQTGMPESGKLDCQEPANSCAENQQTITEITTETTTEITSDILDSGEPNTKPQKSKRASRVPDEFLVDQRMLDWLDENEITADWRSETSNFLDHHRAKGSTMKDWVAAWRMWMRNSKKFARPAVPVTAPPTAKAQVSDSLSNIHDTNW